ncbi:MAG TPA: hypothetical protein VK571_06415 [Gemmatimonadaceae bacterium]|nr:hypothetical protein [Gemmatimonadaceae bacterium]
MSLLDPDLLNARNPRLFAILSGARPAHRISTGIYSVATFNFNLLLDDDWDDFPNELPGGLEESYGVVDSVEQFTDRFWGALSDDPHGYVVAFTRVRKSEQPTEGGWRWCKWGPYLGVGSPQCDYLHGEPHFNEVFCFHVYRHKSWRVGGVYGWDEES